MTKLLVAAFVCAIGFQAAAAPVGESSTPMESPELTKRVSLSVEPLWLLLGGIGAKTDFNVSKKVSLGLQALYIPSHSSNTSSDDKTTTTTDYSYKWSYEEYNVGANIMLMGNIDGNGLYINPAVGYVRSKITDFSIFKYQGELAAPQFRTTVGYQWIVGSFRFAAGGGYRLVSSNDIVIKDSKGNEVSREKSSTLGGLALDGHVGFTF
jgi:hypothetical protein